MGQRVKLRLNQGETDSVKIGRGVRQGCCMSPILFNLYGEYLIKETLAEVGDFKIGGRIINSSSREPVNVPRLVIGLAILS
jgi:Reverse transcriptase (RNA-dependent DNA polymerase).